jgi:co-chaperonin GroES (HSP10)
MMEMFRPLHQLVTVILDPKVDRTEGGLMIPDTVQASSIMGTVRAAGPEAGYKKNGTEYTLQAGDRVMLGCQKDPRTRTIVNFGTIKDDDGTEVALVNYQDIWGTMPRNNAATNG